MGRSDETDRDAVMLEDVFAAARDEARRASSSFSQAASIRASRASSRVASVARMRPLKPCFTSSGSRPQWSRWACVNRT